MRGRGETGEAKVVVCERKWKGDNYGRLKYRIKNTEGNRQCVVDKD